MTLFSKPPVRFFRKFVLGIAALLITATGCIHQDPDDDSDGRTYEFEVHFIATHPHADHIGGMVLVRRGKIPNKPSC